MSDQTKGKNVDVETIQLLSQAIAAEASGDSELARTNVQAAHTRLVNRSKQPTLPGMPAPEPAPSRANDRRLAAVPQLFAYWQHRCDHASAKLTPERSRCVLARLRDGYTEAEIRKAIDGAAVAAFVNEDNGHRYDDLTLICRNGSKLESFMERGVKATGAIEVVATGDGSSIDERISELRRTMAAMKRDGRVTEYENAAADLKRLMAERSAG